MIKKIRVEDLEPGMFVADFNTPWVFHPFLPNRKRLETRRDIDLMLEYGITEVYIDTARGRDSTRAVCQTEADRDLADALAAAGEGGEDPQPVPFPAEFRKARQVYREARTAVRGQFARVHSGSRVDGDTARLTVGDMISSMFRNRDALLSLARLKSFDEYTFQHSLNVAVLALNLGMSLGILNDELLRLGIGAVLHDMGKVRVPDQLIRKDGPLDRREFELVKSHAAHGARIILEARTLPLDCAAVPLSHHERFDGTGYPRRLSGPRVGKFGLITAIADVYDAMTSDRPYQRGMSPTLALRKLYGWAGTHFHPLYVRRFIQCVGIYPVGTGVLLDTGEAGVVIRQNRADLLRPWVRLRLGPHRVSLPRPTDVDLRSPDPRGERPFARSVVRVLDARRAGLDPEALLETDAVPAVA